MRKTIQQLEEELAKAKSAKADAETRLSTIKEFLIKATDNSSYSRYGGSDKSAFELLNELVASSTDWRARFMMLDKELKFYRHLIRVYSNDFTLKIETEAQLNGKTQQDDIN